MLYIIRLFSQVAKPEPKKDFNPVLPFDPIVEEDSKMTIESGSYSLQEVKQSAQLLLRKLEPSIAAKFNSPQINLKHASELLLGYAIAETKDN